MATRSRRRKTCTVVGGCGFLGRHLVESLLERGYQVNVYDLKQTYEDDRVRFFTGSINNLEEVVPALLGMSVVFHCASPPASSNNRSLFWKVNVEGTKTLIAACKQAGVQKLVLTSSASVVYEGKDIENGSEDLQYAASPIDYYTETKIHQEKLVLNANNTDEDQGPVLLTVAIRPHGIFGPRDVQNFPQVVAAAKAGKMKFIIGNGENMVDFTYVENVTYGHILAAESLHVESSVCGKAYNITNDEPVKFWDYISKVLVGLNYPPPRYKLPYTLVLALSVIMSWFTWFLSPVVSIETTFTPMRVRLAGTHHYYSCDRAKKDFGYSPLRDFEEGMQKSLEHFSHLRNS